MSDDAEVFTVRLDRYHRHWPVAVWLLFQGVVVLTMVETWRWGYVPRYLGAALGFTAILGLYWWGQKRRCLILSSGGVVERGWITETVARYADVRGHEMFLEDDRLGLSDEGVGEFFLSLLAQFTMRPLRWILRHTIYGGQSDVFYRGVLTLYGHEKHRLIRIEASDGWEQVEDVFQRITHKVEQRATASSVTSSRS